jgi:hypothetical protein
VFARHVAYGVVRVGGSIRLVLGAFYKCEIHSGGARVGALLGGLGRYLQVAADTHEQAAELSCR